MKFLDLLKTSARNAFGSKARTILTILSLFVGAFTLTITMALGAGVSSYLNTQVDGLGLDGQLMVSHAVAQVEKTSGIAKYDPEGSRGFSNQTPTLTSEDITRIEQVEGVEKVIPWRRIDTNWISGVSGEKYTLLVDPAATQTYDLVVGKQLDLESQEFQIILTRDYAKALGFDTPDQAIGQKVTVGLTDMLGNAQEAQANVQGVANANILTPNNGLGINTAFADKLEELFKAGIEVNRPEYYTAIAFVVGDATEENLKQVKANLLEQGFESNSIEDQLGIVQSVLDGIILVLNFFALVALFAAAFGIINTLYMSVQERTREIGLMKALGMSKTKIFSLFSLEAVFIGFFGSLFGVFVAVGAGLAGNIALTETFLGDLEGLSLFVFEPSSALLVMLLVMFIAFMAGILPAQRASKQHPVDALRYE